MKPDKLILLTLMVAFLAFGMADAQTDKPKLVSSGKPVPSGHTNLASVLQPSPRLIAVPSGLADEYKKAIETEQGAFNAATQTPQWKDYQTAQQQRLRVEAFIFGEVGCKPSQARIIRNKDNNIILNKEGRIENVECSDAKEQKP